jgi:hypothetical protein
LSNKDGRPACLRNGHRDAVEVQAYFGVIVPSNPVVCVKPPAVK